MEQRPPEEIARDRLRTLCEEIKRHIDYRQFFLRYCPQANVSGAQLKAHCPIPAHAHSGEGQPSFSADLSRGLYHCFSRADGGDAIRFFEQVHQIPFARAVHRMAADLGLSSAAGGGEDNAPPATDGEQPPFVPAASPPLPTELMSQICGRFLEICRAENQIEGVRYLTKRGISLPVLARAGVAYFPRSAYRRVMRRLAQSFTAEQLRRSGLFNDQDRLTFYRHRLLFPFYVDGRPIYIQARTTAASTSKAEPRWHNLRGNVPGLYNIDSLDRLPGGGIIYLVEGFTDTLTLLTHNFAALGLVGAGGLKSEWLAPLGRFSVALALDADRAGETAAARYQEMFAARGITCARVRLPTDVNDFFRQNPAAAVELALKTETAFAASVEKSVNDGAGN